MCSKFTTKITPTATILCQICSWSYICATNDIEKIFCGLIKFGKVFIYLSVLFGGAGISQGCLEENMKLGLGSLHGSSVFYHEGSNSAIVHRIRSAVSGPGASHCLGSSVSGVWTSMIQFPQKCLGCQCQVNGW